MLMLCLDPVPVGWIWKLTEAAVSQVSQDYSAAALAPAEAVMDLCLPAAEEVAAELAAEQLVVMAATVAVAACCGGCNSVQFARERFLAISCPPDAM
eukprot:2856330-Rhodomonas_salina.1